MSPHENLTDYDHNWPMLFESEAQRLRAAIGSDVLDIQHIGSTAIPGLSAKPIIDIAALVESPDKANALIDLLENLGYAYDESSSSSERHFFRNYENGQAFHLSLAYRDRGGYWERQLQFRDYLREHGNKRKEYEKLKRSLLEADPSGRKHYIAGKSKFIETILSEHEANSYK